MMLDASTLHHATQLLERLWDNPDHCYHNDDARVKLHFDYVFMSIERTFYHQKILFSIYDYLNPFPLEFCLYHFYIVDIHRFSSL